MTNASLLDLQKEVMHEFPRFRVRYKSDVWWMRALGCFMGKRFMDSFLTTIRNTVYLPRFWGTWIPETQCALLRHERVHMRQARRVTFPLFAFLYALVFFPIGLAWFRARFEKEAYEEEIVAWKEYGMDYAGARDRLVGYFTGSAYGWMWPFKKSMERWFDGVVSRLRA
jgi:hypothetical protein